MPQFRNVSDQTLWTVTDAGLVKVEPDSVLTVSDEWASTVYFQTGETGEPVIWEPVVQVSKKKTTDQPATEPSDN